MSALDLALGSLAACGTPCAGNVVECDCHVRAIAVF